MMNEKLETERFYPEETLVEKVQSGVFGLVASGQAGHSRETAGDNPEEGGDDVKSSCPL